MKMESVAVLRWIDSTTLARGEDAVVAVLESALQDAVAANGLVPTGPLVVRPSSVEEYPHTEAGRPPDDPGALLHLAEVDVEPVTRESLDEAEGS